MTLIADFVAANSGSAAPIVFLDSCVLLDIVRAPRRNKPSEVLVAKQFLTSVGKTPKALLIVVGSPTQREWTDHIDKTVDECEDAVTNCNSVAAAYGHLGLSPMAPVAVGTPSLAGMLRQLSTDLLDAGVKLDHDAAALSRAVDRLISSIVPARKGGTGAKDAVIIEHVIETTTKLRAAHYTGKCVFVSSNTKDFAMSGSTSVHKVLEPDFLAINLEYATSLTHAESILTASGWAG